MAKKKSASKQKNKKGKNQETSGDQTPQPDPPVVEQQQEEQQEEQQQQLEQQETPQPELSTPEPEQQAETEEQQPPPEAPQPELSTEEPAVQPESQQEVQQEDQQDPQQEQSQPEVSTEEPVPEPQQVEEQVQEPPTAQPEPTSEQAEEQPEGLQEQQDIQPDEQQHEQSPTDAEAQIETEAVAEPAAEAPIESQPAETEPVSETVPEPAQESESVPNQEPELEQPQASVEPDSTVPVDEAPVQSPANEEGGFEQPEVPEPAQVEQSDVNDVQTYSEQPQESSWEEIGTSEQHAGDAEEHHETNPFQFEASGAAETVEETPVTAPQTPLDSSFVPTQSWEPLEEPQPQADSSFVAAPFGSNTGAPETYSHIPEMSEPFADTVVAQPTPFSDTFAPSSATPASKPGSPIPQSGSPIQRTASPSFKSMSPGPQSAAATPRATSPVHQSASPVRPYHSPVQQYTSPMAQPASPIREATVLSQRSASPTPPGASPVFQSASPAVQQYSPVQKVASPVQKTVSPVQKHVSPVAKPASPVPKVSSPLARGHMSPMMSPQMAPPPMTARMHQQPTAIPPYPPSYHSPIMSANGFLPQYAYYQPSPNMHPTPRGSIDPGSAASFQALQNLGFGNGHPLNGKGGTISPPHEHEEPIELLQRIQDAIPDIGRLLNSYKTTKGKLQARESEFKQMKNQHEQELMHKDFYIDALQNQMRKAASESAEESTRLKNTINELRMELGNENEKKKDLQERLHDSEKANEELTQTKAELEEEVKTLNTNLQEAHETYERDMEAARQDKESSLATQKKELTEMFEEIKAEDEKAAAEALAARERELLDQQDAMKNDYENQKQQMQEAHDTLQADFDSKVAELGSTKEELETRTTELADKQKELEVTIETNAKEMEDLRQAHASEVESLNNSHAEKVAEMEKEHSDRQQKWADEKTDLEGRLSDKIQALEFCERENKKLEEDNLVKEKQVQHAVDGMRLTIDNLDKDCDRLRKTLHSLGEATDLKSTKGDTFFLDCFGQLSRLIVSLSKEHFSYLPIDPPKDILSKLPSELPSFLDNTPASVELRSAYVQHVISKTLTYRIFHPFLFTLGRRFDKADTFFQMLSMDIRRKSVRREAFWRQQTLKAAYTTSDAKQSINVVAAVIVDEIIDQLKHFADPKNLDALLVSVRKIVKLAAETWRLARVERELILASLPSPDADAVSNDDWEEYGTPKEGSLSSKEDPTRHVILRTFPRITREAAHEDFAIDEEKYNPCTYSRGCVLYSDSPVVMARLQELAKKSEDSPRRGSRDSSRSDGSPSPRRSRDGMRA
ncbi:uncharacterized protein AKAW2_70698S [Aspergillus luchuensis]|uniref:RNA polymerase Rpb1 C-terminal repeat domain-containing protein n=1 Tax=Aspergillus kawachii TaxID=1069201 RepID=A0A146FU53_ASPKA|nr:uncharacterized protein AKAW2_70698S [Aspergillus luchuensis]BCS03820.1 hypothetical protein AKAW2_70698S [Aspergillus luchuensis]BCS15435.1 hypothetical protein ALUC_70668S [Aspergillus luchuensis]GAA89366.1 RNA polymerase Rpb1 C-terminal repeat domain-containing protein [Aspergillus luchuensis IFO 4308]GAT28978.1 RNA polymerase Rpb1 C-terminal repeat domain-containing protein [Aspergillus luchuensis]